MNTKQTLHLVDASGYLFRSYYALPPMKRQDGVSVQGVYGFVGMLTRLLARKDIALLGVVFDTSRKSFRQGIYEHYKAHRPPPPPDLVPQFALIREATKVFGLPILEAEGFEADDLIATYAVMGRENGYQVVIDSSDKDMMQLVDDEITMHDPLKNRKIGASEVEAQYGVPPEKMVDLQALAGDSSDNIPGVPGIGVKTAALLLQTYGGLEDVLANVDTIPQTKRRERIKEHQEDARVSYRLASLCKNVPVKAELSALVREPVDQAQLVAFLQEQGFQRYLREVHKHSLSPRQETNENTSNKVSSSTGDAVTDFVTGDFSKYKNYEMVCEEAPLRSWVEKAKTAGILAIDTETTSLDVQNATLVGISLAVGEGQACYIPLAHKGEDVVKEVQNADLLAAVQQETSENQTQKFDQEKEKIQQLSLETVRDVLDAVLRDERVLKVGQNIKYDLHILGKHGMDVYPVMDTMLMSFVLDAGREDSGGHSLDSLAMRHLDYKTMRFEEVVGKGAKKKTFDSVSLDIATKYAAEDADITLRIYDILKKRLDISQQNTLYYGVELKLVQVLRKIEANGVKIDRNGLALLSRAFYEKEKALEATMFAVAGREFMPGSPKQVREILFDVMGLSSGAKTKTGLEATRVDVLEDLAREGHDIARHLLSWRGFNKLRTTYTDALVQVMTPTYDLVHTTYAMTGARTGRLSSQSPNLQNIPVRTAEGRSIRKTFIARDKHQFLALDYNQIELRLFADFAGEETMLTAFLGGADIHALTASRVFATPLDAVDATQRRRAKAINFGIIYGMSAFGLAKQLGIGHKEARRFIGAYFREFPRLKDYQEELLKEARERGYVATPFGRRLYIADLQHRNASLRQHAERQAINAPIQGAAADVIKRAMIRIDKLLDEKNLSGKMVLQVHDEIVLEVPEGEVDITESLVVDVMENAAKPIYDMKIPLRVDTGRGSNWEEAH